MDHSRFEVIANPAELVTDDLLDLLADGPGNLVVSGETLKAMATELRKARFYLILPLEN